VLERLQVRSLGIIDAVELELGPGFVVLTGETGAGKSLLVESLKLLAGQRAQADMVRSGEPRLSVEGWFSVDPSSPQAALLDDLGVTGDGTAVIRREVARTGRSRAWINDVTVTASSLQALAPHLLAIHGQHEQHGLADAAVQRRLVDEFGDHAGSLGQVREAFAQWSAAAQALQRLRSAQDRRRDRLDTISFQLAEIDAVAPRPDEDVELALRRQLLRNAVRLLEVSGAVLERLSENDGAAVDSLAQAERDVEEMIACGLPLTGGVERLAEARVLVEEVVREVQHMVGGVQEDPAELEAVESRLHRIEQLLLKYGSPISSVIDHRERLVAERCELEQVEEHVQAASAEVEKALATYAELAEDLDRARGETGERLAGAVEEVLGRLNMAGTRLQFRWAAQFDNVSPLVRDGRGVAFGEDGVEECAVMIAPNPGEELRPMARIASGGELSRLHLALRTALRGRQGDSGLTLLFDEVDSGLGGAAAAALAKLLADLAIHDQVLVVTHLPQVAARAAVHFRVEKVMDDGRAVTRVEMLGGEERELELARMLAGEELSVSARAHARSLLESG